LGGALLAKVTGVLLVPQLAWMMRRRPRGLGLFLIVALVICGWYYLRNVAIFGRPFVSGWDPSTTGWWQEPGYRTPESFLTFGQSLINPVYAGLNDLGDSLYSTLWADGFLSSRMVWDARPPWNYTLMGACVLLSIPATLALGIGLVRAARDRCLRFAAIFLAIFLLALCSLYITLPIYSTAKASYFLGGIPCLAVLVAAGFKPFVQKKWMAAIVFGWLMAWSISAYGTYLIGSPAFGL
jgi:hypothetical protein